MRINAKCVNPFIEAGIKVVKEIAKIDVRRGHLTIKKKPDPSYGVCIIIGVYGFLVGQVVYSMKTEVAKRLVEKMLANYSPEEKEVLFIDTLGELANMITGNATAILNKKQDYELKITTPAIATGNNLSISLVSKPTIVLGLYSQYGPIEISIALEESEKNASKENINKMMESS